MESLLTEPFSRYPRPPPLYFPLVSILFTIRKNVLRYFFLPRPYILRVQGTTDEPTKEGKYFQRLWAGAPYYVKPTLWLRWGPTAWISRLMGLPLPGDEGEKYCPQGYKIREVGPATMHKKGTQAVEETIQTLKRTRTGGCPFTVAKTD